MVQIKSVHYDVVCSADDRIEWLKARRTGVGASDSPAILGTPGAWGSAIAMFAEKLNTDEPVDEESERMEWGKLLEPVLIAKFKRVTEREVTKGQWLLRSKKWPWMLSTQDASQDIDDEDCPLELKNTVMGQQWTDGVPPHVWVQCQHQLAVTGASQGSVAVLIAGCSFKWLDIKRDYNFIDNTLVPECRMFWERVKHGGPPPMPDASQASTDALSKLFPADFGSTIHLDGDFMEKAGEFVRLRDSLKADKEALDLIKNEVKLAIGENTYGAMADTSLFSWKANKKGVRSLLYREAKA